MATTHELQALRAWKARLDSRIAELEALAQAQQRQAEEQDTDYMRPALSDAGFQQFLLRRQLEGGR
jgi:hypothetical protein